MVRLKNPRRWKKGNVSLILILQILPKAVEEEEEEERSSSTLITISGAEEGVR